MATLLEKNTQKLVQKKLDVLFAKQQQLNGNSNGQREMHDGGGIPHSHNTSISGDYGYGFQPWQQQGYNASLSPIGLDPRNTTGFGQNWGQPYSGPRPIQTGQNTPVNTLYNPDTQYKGPVPTGGIYNPGIAPPMFQNPSWWNNIQPSDQQTNMATDPRFGTFNSVPEAGAPTTSGVNRPLNMGLPVSTLAYRAPSAPTYGSNFFNQMQQPVRPTAVPINKVTTSNITPTTELAPAPNVNTTNTSSGTNWGKVGTMAGQIAPMVYNMIKGLQRPDKVKPNYNPYESQIRSTMANRRFNIDPLLNANRVGQAVNNRQIRDAAGSRGELMSNLGASQNARMAGDAAAWAQKNNMDNQYLGQQAEMDAQLGGQRAGMDWNVQMGNAGNKAATQQFMSQGFNDLGRFAQTQQLMENQRLNSSDLGGIYQDIYGGLANFTPELEKIRKKYNINPKR